MPPALRSLAFLLLGFLLGAFVVSAWLGRYSIHPVSTGGDMGSIHVYRLNRWNGQVVSVGGLAAKGPHSLPKGDAGE